MFPVPIPLSHWPDFWKFDKWFYMMKQTCLTGCLHVKFHLGMKSSLSMVKCLLLFTRFCRDKISSRDKREGWNFIPGWKKEKKTCKHFIPDEILKWAFFLNFFLTYVFKYAFKVNVFDHNESMNVMKHKASLLKVEFEKKMDKDNKQKTRYVKTFLLFLLFSLWSLEKNFILP